MQERSVTSGDEDLALKVNETIQLWTDMWMADSERYNQMRNLLESMQSSSEGLVDELMDCLERITVSMSSRPDHFLETSTALATQSCMVVQEKQEVVLRHREAFKNDAEALNGSWIHSPAQHAGANSQDDGHSLQLQQMVPCTEVSLELHDAEARPSDFRSLERENARQRDLIECLTSRLSEMLSQNSEILIKLQV